MTLTLIILTLIILQNTARFVFLNNPDHIKTKTDFEKHLQQQTPKLKPQANELCQKLNSILQLNQDIKKRFKRNLNPLFLDTFTDINEQLQHLIYPNFLNQCQPQTLRQYPRYLKAILKRLDKLDYNPQKDRPLRLQIQPHWQHYKQLKHKNTHQTQHYHWMLEEYRISLFAQELGTNFPISAKRLMQYKKQIKCT